MQRVRKLIYDINTMLVLCYSKDSYVEWYVIKNIALLVSCKLVSAVGLNVVDFNLSCTDCIIYQHIHSHDCGACQDGMVPVGGERN